MMREVEKRLNELRESQQELAEALMSVYEAQDWRPDAAEWSFREIGAHMRQVEIECVYSRIQAIAVGANPTFTYYLNTGWHFGHVDLMDAVTDWLLWREQVALVVRDLSDEQLRYTGTHAHFGTITTADMLQIALEHDQEHLADLVKLIEQFRNE